MAPESMSLGVKKNEEIMTTKEAQTDNIHRMRSSLRYASKNIIIVKQCYQLRSTSTFHSSLIGASLAVVIANEQVSNTNSN